MGFFKEKEKKMTPLDANGLPPRRKLNTRQKLEQVRVRNAFKNSVHYLPSLPEPAPERPHYPFDECYQYSCANPYDRQHSFSPKPTFRPRASSSATTAVASTSGSKGSVASLGSTAVASTSGPKGSVASLGSTAVASTSGSKDSIGSLASTSSISTAVNTEPPKSILRRPSVYFPTRETVDDDTASIRLVPSSGPDPSPKQERGTRFSATPETRIIPSVEPEIPTFPPVQAPQAPQQPKPLRKGITVGVPPGRKHHHPGALTTEQLLAQTGCAYGPYQIPDPKTAPPPEPFVPLLPRKLSAAEVEARERLPSYAKMRLLPGERPKKPAADIPQGRYRFHTQSLDWQVNKFPRYDTAYGSIHTDFHSNERWLPLANYPPLPDLLPAGTDIQSLIPFPYCPLPMLTKTIAKALSDRGKRIQDHLEVDDIESKKCWDTEIPIGVGDPWKFNIVKKWRVVIPEKQWRERERKHHMFGGSLKNIEDGGGMVWIPIFGYMHQVPRVMAACVERLNRGGLDTPDLLRAKADTGLLMSLVCQFDAFKSDRPFPDLTYEDPVLVFSLLCSFIESLQGPVIHRTYFEALWHWCVKPVMDREVEYRTRVQYLRVQLYGEDVESEDEDDIFDEEMIYNTNGLPSLNSSKIRRRKVNKRRKMEERRRWAADHPEEAKAQRLDKGKMKRRFLERELYRHDTHEVALARCILMCLPPRAFAYITYLFTFLSRLPQHPENDVRYDHIADLFSWGILGGASRRFSNELMRFLLTRWWRIADGFKSKECKAEEEKLIQKQIDEHGSMDHHFYIPSDIIDEPEPPKGKARDDFPERMPNPHDRTPREVQVATPPAAPTTQTENPFAELGEDITVIAPFIVHDEGYGSDDERERERTTAPRVLKTQKPVRAVSTMSSDWNLPQREAFSAIKDLLQEQKPKKPVAPEIETDVSSVYSQDAQEDFSLESLIDEYAAANTPGSVKGAAPLDGVEDQDALKRQLREALEERDRAQKRIEEMQKKFMATKLSDRR